MPLVETKVFCNFLFSTHILTCHQCNSTHNAILLILSVNCVLLNITIFCFFLSIYLLENKVNVNMLASSYQQLYSILYVFAFHTVSIISIVNNDFYNLFRTSLLEYDLIFSGQHACSSKSKREKIGTLYRQRKHGVALDK